MVRFQIYRDRIGGYRWRIVAANNKIVSVSSESYDTKQGVKDSVNWIKYWADKAPVYDLTI